MTADRVGKAQGLTELLRERRPAQRVAAIADMDMIRERLMSGQVTATAVE